MAIANNTIEYTSTDGNIVSPKMSKYTFGDNLSIVSNTYSNGKGVITFNKDVTAFNGHNSTSGSDSSCFNRCTTLKTITLPETVETIGNSPFGGCASLQEINLPKTKNLVILQGAFRDCSALKKIIFYENVTSIGMDATDVTCDVFYNCTSLETIEIRSKSLVQINTTCFKYLDWAKSLDKIFVYFQLEDKYKSLSHLQTIKDKIIGAKFNNEIATQKEAYEIATDFQEDVSDLKPHIVYKGGVDEGMKGSNIYFIKNTSFVWNGYTLYEWSIYGEEDYYVYTTDSPDLLKNSVSVPLIYVAGTFNRLLSQGDVSGIDENGIGNYVKINPKQCTTKKFALAVGCSVLGNYADDNLVKYVNLIKYVPNGDVRTTQPSYGSLYVQYDLNSKKTYTSLSSVNKSTRIYVFCYPNEGYQTDSVTIKDINGNAVTVTRTDAPTANFGQDYIGYFTMPQETVIITASLSIAYYNITVISPSSGTLKCYDYIPDGKLITQAKFKDTVYIMYNNNNSDGVTKKARNVTVTYGSSKNVTVTEIVKGDDYLFIMPSSPVTVKCDVSTYYRIYTSTSAGSVTTYTGTFNTNKNETRILNGEKVYIVWNEPSNTTSKYTFSSWDVANHSDVSKKVTVQSDSYGSYFTMPEYNVRITANVTEDKILKIYAYASSSGNNNNPDNNTDYIVFSAKTDNYSSYQPISASANYITAYTNETVYVVRYTKSDVGTHLRGYELNKLMVIYDTSNSTNTQNITSNMFSVTVPTGRTYAKLNYVYDPATYSNITITQPSDTETKIYYGYSDNSVTKTTNDTGVVNGKFVHVKHGTVSSGYKFEWSIYDSDKNKISITNDKYIDDNFLYIIPSNYYFRMPRKNVTITASVTPNPHMFTIKSQTKNVSYWVGSRSETPPDVSEWTKLTTTQLGGWTSYGWIIYFARTTKVSHTSYSLSVTRDDTGAALSYMPKMDSQAPPQAIYFYLAMPDSDITIELTETKETSYTLSVEDSIPNKNNLNLFQELEEELYTQVKISGETSWSNNLSTPGNDFTKTIYSGDTVYVRAVNYSSGAKYIKNLAYSLIPVDSSGNQITSIPITTYNYTGNDLTFKITTKNNYLITQLTTGYTYNLILAKTTGGNINISGFNISDTTYDLTTQKTITVYAGVRYGINAIANDGYTFKQLKIGNNTYTVSGVAYRMPLSNITVIPVFETSASVKNITVRGEDCYHEYTDEDENSQTLLLGCTYIGKNSSANVNMLTVEENSTIYAVSMANDSISGGTVYCSGIKIYNSSWEDVTTGYTYTNKSYYYIIQTKSENITVKLQYSPQYLANTNICLISIPSTSMANRILYQKNQVYNKSLFEDCFLDVSNNIEVFKSFFEDGVADYGGDSIEQNSVYDDLIQNGVEELPGDDKTLCEFDCCQPGCQAVFYVPITSSNGAPNSSVFVSFYNNYEKMLLSIDCSLNSEHGATEQYTNYDNENLYCNINISTYNSETDSNRFGFNGYLVHIYCSLKSADYRSCLPKYIAISTDNSDKYGISYSHNGINKNSSYNSNNPLNEYMLPFFNLNIEVCEYLNPSNEDSLMYTRNLNKIRLTDEYFANYCTLPSPSSLGGNFYHVVPNDGIQNSSYLGFLGAKALDIFNNLKEDGESDYLYNTSDHGFVLTMYPYFESILSGYTSSFDYSQNITITLCLASELISVNQIYDINNISCSSCGTLFSKDFVDDIGSDKVKTGGIFAMTLSEILGFQSHNAFKKFIICSSKDPFSIAFDFTNLFKNDINNIKYEIIGEDGEIMFTDVTDEYNSWEFNNRGYYLYLSIGYAGQIWSYVFNTKGTEAELARPINKCFCNLESEYNTVAVMEDETRIMLYDKK